MTDPPPADVARRLPPLLNRLTQARLLLSNRRENEMAAHTSGQGAGAKGEDQVKDMAAHAAKSVGDAVDAKRETAADVIDDVADTVGEKGKSAPDPVKRYSRAAKDKLHDAAEYVRDTDPEGMGRDALDAAKAYPIASLLILGAVVIGGSMLVAAMIEDGNEGDGSRKPFGLASATSGLGPKGKENLTRIRDAAFGFVLAKAVEMADDMWPGFKEHYEKS
jgi:hypothetical protein